MIGVPQYRLGCKNSSKISAFGDKICFVIVNNLSNFSYLLGDDLQKLLIGPPEKKLEPLLIPPMGGDLGAG
jgi:hypothetical protein